MTPDDVAYAVAWQQANNYQLTLAFNGFYADAAADPLTQSLQANKAAFRWLNHGFEHIYQGCVQDFSVTPWRCTTDAGGNIVWTSQAGHLQRDRTEHRRRPGPRSDVRSQPSISAASTPAFSSSRSNRWTTPTSSPR